MRTMEELLRETADLGASDLHLSAGLPPLMRIHGDLTRTEHPALSAAGVTALVNSIMSEEQRQTFQAEHEIDFACEVPGKGRFRVNAFVQSRGPGAVLRTIPTAIPTLESLNLPPVLKELCTRERGLVLVTGPTGSGKSTTLAAMVDLINQTWDAHILTVEDPIEFVHPPKRCLVNQREVGPHTRSFSNALRSALREDPDVILVGELRDLETMSLALTAAETGHLVFGTLHTSSAPKTIDRIIDVFPAGQQNQIRTMVSESLEAVVAQTLVKRKGGGRIAACEILIGAPAVRNLIREGKLHQIPSIMQTSQRLGMQTLDLALADLMKRGLIEQCALPPRPPGLNGGAAAGAAA
ncbi:MAG: type IV pilus twitching motility protein PilT [Deltaproteobacteria bacterium]|nr:MAG: type IV pilus twitching motility protein PilT [Deltaproteobacteria bacterium]TMB09401.1 MAG: type IV pilus twitching motility protein PilT [Deltaproteobacteria bacterium]